MASGNKLLGDRGCDIQVGAGTYTPSGRHTGKKIWAIQVMATANITNFKYTPTLANGRPGSQVTVTADAWLGTSLDPSVYTEKITLGENADEVVVASGTIMVFFT